MMSIIISSILPFLVGTTWFIQLQTAKPQLRRKISSVLFTSTNIWYNFFSFKDHLLINSIMQFYITTTRWHAFYNNSIALDFLPLRSSFLSEQIGQVSTKIRICSWGIFAYFRFESFFTVCHPTCSFNECSSKMASYNSSTLMYMRLSLLFPYLQNAFRPSLPATSRK